MTEFFGGIPLVEIEQQILQIILIEFCGAPAALRPELPHLASRSYAATDNAYCIAPLFP